MIISKIKKLAFIFLATSVALVFLIGTGHSAGHFISGLQNKYPAYDLNDTYVFQSSNEGYTTFISSSNPSAPESTISPAGVVFGHRGHYNFHIAQDGEFMTGMTLIFSFQGNNVEIRKINVPNAELGVNKPNTKISEKNKLIGSGKVGEVLSLSNGIRVWTGRGDDPFFGNGVGLSKFNGAKQKGKFTPSVFKENGDLFADATASFIVVDVPNKMLGKQVKFFTTTSVVHNDEWKQVDRHANVLFPYVFFFDTPAVQEDHGQHRPDLDVEERRQAIVNNVFWAVSVSNSKQGNTAKEYANKIADMVMPDVLTYKPGTKASYTVKGLNGRPLHDDAMDTVLQLFNGVAIDDNAYNKNRYKLQFPYIIPEK